MRNLLLTIAYDGRPYHGWQIQKNALTVQQVLQEALSGILGSAPPLKGCSRTDSGVHARCFCVSMKTESTIPCERLVMALNSRLPESVAALSCREVPLEFHARYSATGKEYSYELWNSKNRNPFLYRLATHFPMPLDEGRLFEESRPILGRHDFSCFCAAGSSVADNVRTVRRIEFFRNGELLTMQIEADGFLYNMVRIVMGTLLDIERGNISRGSMVDIIESKSRSSAGITAPPDGLYLNKVFYDPESFL